MPQNRRKHCIGRMDRAGYLTLVLTVSLHAANIAFAQEVEKKDFLLLLEDYEADSGCGYMNSSGDTIVPVGQYQRCFTDTFQTYAIVLSWENNYEAINRQFEVIFEVYPYDNGPDYPAEGLFRILKNQKIGYADTSGTIVIEPRYACAFPFHGGKAKVSYYCELINHEEHSWWESDHWFFIDHSGKEIISDNKQ